MATPVEIRFHDVPHSDFIEARVREKIAELEKVYDRIHSIRVVIDKESNRHQKGNTYRIRLFIHVPGKEIVINHNQRDDPAREDFKFALREAFDAAERELKEFKAKQRGEVKRHEEPPQGRVVRLFRDQGYGFIELDDGQEIYFHRNAVVNNGFDGLEIGTRVRVHVAENESPFGPQASTVHRIE
ncbi:Cold shock protein 1 [bacterium HR40]|nr:Cold shock protein 1 [bacterium HR40]